MMRMQTAIFCALAASLSFAVSCADSGTGDDDQMGDDQQHVCGDGVCAAAEVGTCTNDCGNGGNNNNGAVCGNGMCETTLGENGATCLQDCGNMGTGSGSGSGSGNGSTTCPADPTECLFCLIDASLCMNGLTATTCQACVGGLGGGGGGSGFGDLLCEGGAPDGTCNANAGEDNMTCPSDCP